MKHAIIAREWDPDGPASLKNFFVGACILQFPNVYDVWSRHRARWEDNPRLVRERFAAPEAALPDVTSTDAIFVLMRNALLREPPARDREVIWLLLNERTYSEIATATGLTSRTVEGIVRRVRARASRGEFGDSGRARRSACPDRRRAHRHARGSAGAQHARTRSRSRRLPRRAARPAGGGLAGRRPRRSRRPRRPADPCSATFLPGPARPPRPAHAMSPAPDRTQIAAGLIVTLALFVLLGSVVYLLRNSPGANVAVVLSAMATVMTALPAVLLALVGRDRRRR
jgi:hypothetical protein